MVAPWKYKEVEELGQLMKKYPIVGIAGIESLPAAQFQEIKAKVKDHAIIRVARKRLIKRAIEEHRPELKGLEDYMEGPIALVFSDMNAFKLYNTIKRMKSKAPIKAGQVAPNDIIVPAGDTGLPPGPALGDLKAAGINARIEGSTIKVVKDSLVAREGEVVPEAVANALNKLGIKPVEIFLRIKAVYEDGTIFTPEVLDISEEETLAKIQTAYQRAFNLAVNAAYPTPAVMDVLISKAFSNARNLAVEIAFPAKQVIGDILAKAHMQANALKALTGQ